jgi:hypothetical protein
MLSGMSLNKAWKPGTIASPVILAAWEAEIGRIIVRKANLGK